MYHKSNETLKDDKFTDEKPTLSRDDIRQVKNELKSEFRKAKEHLVDSAEDAADATSQQLRRMARETGARVQSFLSTKKDRLYDAKDSCERTIKDNPFTTAIAAFAGGLALGRLLLRGK